jgi:hypothetical protein
VVKGARSTVNRTALLDQNGAIRPEATEVLGKENDIHIAKMAGLAERRVNGDTCHQGQ